MLMVGMPRGMRPLGRQRCRWVDNIRMDLGEVGWGDVYWIGLAQNRDKWSSCECGNELLGSINSWETMKWLHSWWPLK
jgi:hypothetical protein